MLNHQGVWMRLAVNKQAWQMNDLRRWRLFVDPSIEPVYVRGVRVLGLATDGNHRTLSFDAPDERDVIACLHYYGDVQVGEDDIAHITLREPVHE